MKTKIERHGRGKKLVINPCDEDEVKILDAFDSVDIPLKAILTHKPGEKHLHIEIKWSPS